MIQFLSHQKFEQELKALFKKYRTTADVGFENLKNLLAKQFDNVSPEILIGKSKILRLTVDMDGSRTLWKVEMNVKGLRPSQWPRIWFLVSVDKIFFLHLDTHQENYDNKSSTKMALERSNDFV